ncbi:hypothetical protein G9A89_006333 [Geosiphon pyriformis]|nr:hypothetical protein G9A89_006333 [Geosiphon pyriformis]
MVSRAPALHFLPSELIIAILEFVPSRDLCRYLCLSRQFKYEIRKILIARVQQTFTSGRNCFLTTIESLDTHGPGPTHIFDLVLLDADVDTLNARFKINDASIIPTSNDPHPISPSCTKTSKPAASPKIIARKLDGTDRLETIRLNACINLESTWRPYHDPEQWIKNVSVHVFSPADIYHEAIFVTNGTVTFSGDAKTESLGWWRSAIDRYAEIVVSNSKREFGDFESFLVTAFLEEVVIKSGILLTAIEEKWKDDVTSVVIEESGDSDSG